MDWDRAQGALRGDGHSKVGAHAAFVVCCKRSSQSSAFLFPSSLMRLAKASWMTSVSNLASASQIASFTFRRFPGLDNSTIVSARMLTCMLCCMLGWGFGLLTTHERGSASVTRNVGHIGEGSKIVTTDGGTHAAGSKGVTTDGGTNAKGSKSVTTDRGTHAKGSKGVTVDGGTYEKGSKHVTAVVAHMQTGQNMLLRTVAHRQKGQRICPPMVA